MFVCLSWADLQVSLELKSWVFDEMSFCTDWLYFHFWKLLLLAELMLFLSPFSKFTDGAERLLTESELLRDVDCCGPGSWASLLVTSQTLLTEASFRDCAFIFPSRRVHIWVQMCVCTRCGRASWYSECNLSPH